FQLDLAGQAFNLLNHPQYVPGSVDNVALTNTYTSGALSYVTAASTRFNDPTYAFGSTPRTLQITAKLSW
ncbi:MAG: hypothetical protein ACRD9L_24440, partial [Bryobacteraceae bacterium]